MGLAVITCSACGASGSATTDQSPEATAEVAVVAEASPSPSPTEESGAGLPADLTFDAGTVLDQGDWNMGWGENLSQHDRFSVAGADDGNGSFSYSDDETGCQIFFYNGTVSDLDMAADDRSISDEFLATMLASTVQGSTRADVEAHAFDDAVSQYPGPGTVATRTIWGTGSDGGTWLHSTRMFGAIGAGVYIGIQCPAGADAQNELRLLTEQHIAVIINSVDAG